MIHAIWSDFPGFKKVVFRPGFNVIVAQRELASSVKDSRNGLGKTTLVNILHYLLGSSPASFNLNKDSPAAAWTFFGDVELRGSRWTIARSPAKPSRLLIISSPSDISSASLDIQHDGNLRFVSLTEWTKYLGQVVFSDDVDCGKYSPTFRNLISYFVRRNKDAFNSPFEFYPRQQAWDIQVSNSYLLGLDWRDAVTFQLLRDQEDLIRDLRRAADLGLVTDFLGVRGELEAERTRIEETIAAKDQALRAFTIPDNFKDVEGEADELTTLINNLANANYSARQLLNDYREALTEQSKSSYLDIELLYREAGAILRATFLRELAEVRRFHTELIRNRRSYLDGEIERLESKIRKRDEQIAVANERRAMVLKILEANRALVQFSLLEENLRDLRDKLAVLRERLSKINQIEDASTQLKISREIARRETLQHYTERQAERDAAVRLFNSASTSLYDTPGDLLIDIGKEGFKFSYKILRKGSTGVSNAAIFCYDIALAELWSGRSGLDIVWHDSTLFDPIEERQTARAIEYAASKSETLGFQYLCLLNSDRIPRNEFSSTFDFDSYVILKLSDRAESDGLLGIRF